MTQPLDQSILELLHASQDDVDTINLQVNDRSFGFHAQQAIEKLIKAVIGATRSVMSSYDLGVLIRDATALGEQLPLDADSIERLTAYAGIWRYQEPEPLSDVRRQDLKATIQALREYVLRRLEVLRPSHDWRATT